MRNASIGGRVIRREKHGTEGPLLKDIQRFSQRLTAV
jgi:hypothetical protein